MSKKISQTTKMALYTSAGLIAGNLIAKRFGYNQQLITIIGGLVGTISSQRGEWKKLLS